jgi:hypothetical protein
MTNGWGLTKVNSFHTPCALKGLLESEFVSSTLEEFAVFFKQNSQNGDDHLVFKYQLK